jgi:hypothetical protein
MSDICQLLSDACICDYLYLISLVFKGLWKATQRLSRRAHTKAADCQRKVDNLIDLPAKVLEHKHRQKGNTCNEAADTQLSIISCAEPKFGKAQPLEDVFCIRKEAACRAAHDFPEMMAALPWGVQHCWQLF